jgi:serine/threonine protein kinase
MIISVPPEKFAPQVYRKGLRSDWRQETDFMDLTNLHPGSIVDGYRVGEKIHEGGMAVLYRVEKDGGEFPMLMKVPRLEFGSHPSCYVGFEVEQMILEVLTGPHVPRWVTTGSLEDTPYLVMEYVEGKSLHEYASRAPLPAEEVARLGAALATAVHDLHRQEVIHLDIKPANVLIRPNGCAVLVDFGLARHGHFPDLVEEEFHKPVGTSSYISPEQIMGNRGNPRSDLFALGVILYQLCTGQLPFGEPVTMNGFRRRLFIEPVPPRVWAPDLPEWMQEIILHCLEIEFAQRYATAAQIAFDLEHPGQVSFTERATRLKRAGLPTIFRRWWRSLQPDFGKSAVQIPHLVEASQNMVAIDSGSGQEALHKAILAEVRRATMADGNCRIICVTVIEPDISTEQETGSELANSLYTQRLVELHHWAAELQLPAHRLRFHVLEGANAAASLVDYARQNHVDHIFMGARGSSALRRILGSVSARVVSEAPCTVTVVRPPRDH